MSPKITAAMLKRGPTKRRTNGSLSFLNFRHTLWVEEVAQPFSISGARAQSKRTAHWYAGYMKMGALTVSGRCLDQRDYQNLSNFVRYHHEVLMAHPGTRFAGTRDLAPGLPSIGQGASVDAGEKLLLTLKIPSESLYVRGWINTFTRSNKGVHDPAPPFTLDFFVAIDPLNTDPIISRELVAWDDPKVVRNFVDLEADPVQGNIRRPDPHFAEGTTIP